ncbi:MAG: vitamin K epoxide reductase family protein [Pyrinomonadaceae bacterium]
MRREGVAATETAGSGMGRSGSNIVEGRGTLLYVAAALVSLIGLADAVYLTIEHLAGRSVQCTIVAGCSQVLASPYATVGPVPLAGIGALAYFTVFSCATLSVFGYSLARSLLTVVVALMFLATLWLLIVQAFILRAFCAYCLLSAAVTVTLAIIVVAARYSRRG